MDTVDRLDTKAETTSHYRPRDITTAYDVYKDIAKLPITEQNKETVTYARKLIREYQRNDFQSRL